MLKGNLKEVVVTDEAGKKDLGIPAQPEHAICTCGHLFFLHRKTEEEGKHECVICRVEGNYCGSPIDSGRLRTVPFVDLADMPPLE